MSESSARAVHPLSPTRFATPAALAVLLLLVEYWVFKDRFDTSALVESDRWWAPAIRWLRFNTSWGLCVIATALVIGRSRIFTAVRTLRGEVSRSRVAWSSLGGHFLCLGVFYLLTERLLRPGVPESTLTAILPIPWFVSGAAAGLLLFALIAPPRALLAVLSPLRWIALGSLALGSIVFAIWNHLSGTWPFWEPMARGTMWLAHRMLGWVFAERFYEPETLTLGTESFRVFVNQLCSGYEGVTLFLVFFLVFMALWRDRLRFPQAFLLLPLGALVAWLLNSIRIAALIVLGTLVSPEVALEGFHVYAGWPLLCGVALGCVAVATRMQFFSRSSVARAAGVNPTAVYLAPLLAFTATTMIVGAFSSAPEVLYPVRMLPAVFVLWLYRREHAHLRPVWSRSAAGIGVVAFVVWAGLLRLFPIGLATVPGKSSLEELVLPQAWKVPWWTVRIAGTCILTPIVEELAFRGFLLRRLISTEFENVRPADLTWPAFLVSSLAFGLLHGSWPAGTAAGMLYALAYNRRGRLFDAVLAHAVTNAVMVCVTFATGDWKLWG